MKDKKNKVMLMHNVIAPYRLPLFSEVAKSYNLSVVFYNNDAEGRKWDASINQSGFNYKFLKHIKLVSFVLNFDLSRYLLKNKSDLYVIIDNEENILSNLCVVLTAKLRQKPYILWSGHIPIEGGTIHPMDFHDGLMHQWPIKHVYSFFIQHINRILYKNAASLLAYSEISKRYLIQNGADPKVIFVGTQAMSISLLPEASKSIKLDHKKLQLLYLGYLRPEKGTSTLVEAVLALPASKVQLHIVGDGPEKATLKKLAGSTSSVQFHSYATGKERANWYSSVDALVLPTFFDPWAHVVTESLYYGTPVIVSSSAGASAIIDNGKNGFVIKAGDKKGLIKVLDSLSVNKIVAMKKFIHDSDYARLYDVAADARNFNKAIEKALNDKQN